jgi:hypothetical protein
MGRGGGAVNSVGEEALAGVVVLVPADRPFQSQRRNVPITPIPS